MATKIDGNKASFIAVVIKDFKEAINYQVVE